MTGLQKAFFLHLFCILFNMGVFSDQLTGRRTNSAYSDFTRPTAAHGRFRHVKRQKPFSRRPVSVFYILENHRIPHRIILLHPL
jgi:hypothetical protein